MAAAGRIRFIPDIRTAKRPISIARLGGIGGVRPMRRLCFGGSFNPIHYGHLRCARAAAQKLNYGRVVLIPSGRPPHKRTTAHAATLAHATDRLAMASLAAESEPDRLFEVDDLEVQQGEFSYTVDTAAALKRRGWGDPQHQSKIAW